MSRDPPDLPSFPTRRTSDLREQLRVEVAPAERLLLDLEAGELPLELGDGRVLNRLDRLRLDLRVPDVQLAHLLAERGGRAREQRGAGGGDTRGREEAAAGNDGWGERGSRHGFRSFGWRGG